MTLPNFLIVGATKSGTTSLYHNLRQHPQISMPVKEPKFFLNRKGGEAKTLNAYEKLFEGSEGKKAVGEATTAYLYAEEAPELIKETLGNIKIIISLRNPAEVAFSLWRFMGRFGKRGEKLPFLDALAAEPKRMNDPVFINQKENWPCNFYYFNRALFYEQVKRYIDKFGKENVLVLIFEDFKADPAKTFRTIFEFLEVDPGFVPVLKKENIGNIRHRGLHKIIHNPTPFQARIASALPRKMVEKTRGFLVKLNSKPAPPIDKNIKRELLEKYQPDIKKLSALIGRDLSHWLAG